MIRAVIIDDEPAMQEVNSRYLRHYFPEVELAGMANGVASGVELIKATNPGLLLLDVDLGDGTGFQLLEQLKPYHFKVLFITGFDRYALKAIKFSASDYILKPIDENEFRAAVGKALREINDEKGITVQSEQLLETLRTNFNNKKLVLKTADSMHIVAISDILYCQSDNSYTTFYLSDDERIVVSKSIKEYEELLSEHHFFRSHQSYLVNLNHIKKVDKADGGFLIMHNKKEIPVSVRQKKRLIALLDQL